MLFGCKKSKYENFTRLLTQERGNNDFLIKINERKKSE